MDGKFKRLIPYIIILMFVCLTFTGAADQTTKISGKKEVSTYSDHVQCIFFELVQTENKIETGALTGLRVFSAGTWICFLTLLLWKNSFRLCMKSKSYSFTYARSHLFLYTVYLKGIMIRQKEDGKKRFLPLSL